jgi:hypothetical protein
MYPPSNRQDHLPDRQHRFVPKQAQCRIHPCSVLPSLSRAEGGYHSQSFPNMSGLDISSTNVEKFTPHAESDHTDCTDHTISIESIEQHATCFLLATGRSCDASHHLEESEKCVQGISVRTPKTSEFSFSDSILFA